MAEQNQVEAVEFRTFPLSNRAANALHAELGDHPDIANAYLAGDDEDVWRGAVLLAQPSDLLLLETIERLREDARIVPDSVVAGGFPDQPVTRGAR